MVFHSFKLGLGVSGSIAHIDVTALSALELLLNFIKFSSHAVVLSSKIAIVASNLLVDVTCLGKVSLALFECMVLAAEIVV